MANAKVTLNGTTLIDLTSDTIVESALASGYTAHKSNGETITGTLQLARVNGQTLILAGSVNNNTLIL